MAETFESRDIAEQILASDEIQQEMDDHGVDKSTIQYWIVDAVSSSA